MSKTIDSNELDLADKLDWLSKNYKTDLSIEYLKTDSIILDKLFGGGLPMTKNIQIYSESGYGKSTITISMCRSLCRNGHRVLYIDAEGSVNNNLLTTMGIIKLKEDGDIDWSNTLLYDKQNNPEGNFLFVQISYFEDIEQILETLIPKYNSSGTAIESDFRLVVIDSVAALAPKEYRGDAGEKLSVASAKPGVIAKLLAAFLRKFNGYKTAFNMSFLYINQTRENLSMGYGAKYEDMLPGGKAMLYYTDILVKLTSRGVFKKKCKTVAGEIQDIAVEREVGVICKKNKITNGQITLPLLVKFGEGISNFAALPYILRTKKITNANGEVVNMIEGSGVSLTLTFMKDGKPVSIKCKGLPGLKQAIRDNYNTIYPTIEDADYDVLDKGDLVSDDEF